eukprot:Selendium_serpulae@DN5870_c1_g2_i1.p1
MSLKMDAPLQLEHPMHRFDERANGKRDAESKQPICHRWSPYVMNGGTVVALCGENYCVISGDTRLSTGYRIHTRNSTKMTRLTDKVVIASGGMKAEMTTLHRV